MGDILRHHKLFTNWWTWIGVRLQKERGYQNVMDWMTALSHNQDVFFDDTGLIEVTDFQKGKSSTAKVDIIRFGDITEISKQAFDYIFNVLGADEIEVTIPVSRIVIEDVIQKIPKDIYLQSLIVQPEIREDKRDEQPNTKQVSELPRVSEPDSPKLGVPRKKSTRKQSKQLKQPIAV